MIRGVLVLPAFIIVLGCSRGAPGDFWLLLAAAPGSGVRLADAEVSPSGALIERRVDPVGSSRGSVRRVALLVRRGVGPVRVSAAGGCALVVEEPLAPSGVAERQIEALFELGPAVRVVGPARRFEVRASERCVEAKQAKLELRVGAGAPLDDVRIANDGRTLSAITRGVESLGEHPGWGIVPVSAARRAATEIRARVTLPGGASFERVLEVSALTRSSGLPSIAEGHAVLLAGSGFRLEKKPDRSRAELRALGALTELVPDVRGEFELVDELGRKLVIESGRYDEMPLDCGRSDCHATVAASVRESPMTHALEADLGGRHPLAEPECALACHASGEPGTNDGGFSHVQSELGLATLPANFAELPRALRRLGGVGCLACHGPSRVPPESARWAVLRSDVCAVCHDAPPRYAHVAALATSAMAHADRDPRTRERPECARCHTTWGSRGEPERRPPAHVDGLGIGCVACHDVHGPKALRPGTDVCLPCHSPGEGPLPEASAAAIWAGRGGVDPETGLPLEGPAPHASDPRGCLRCHDAGPIELGRGRGHAFHVGPVSCAPCHAHPPRRRLELAAAARAMLDAIVPLARGTTRSSPPHAETPIAALSPAKARALKNALLVLEDPAADVHNPEYARRLLGGSGSL